jgi:hypothetical protein
MSEVDSRLEMRLVFSMSISPENDCLVGIFEPYSVP